MNNTQQSFEKEIELRLASDLWNEKIARRVISRRRKRFAIAASAISLAVAGFSFFIISVTLRSPADTELETLLALQINSSYELAGGKDSFVDDAIEELITLR
jgi:hypothetical protein